MYPFHTPCFLKCTSLSVIHSHFHRFTLAPDEPHLFAQYKCDEDDSLPHLLRQPGDLSQVKIKPKETHLPPLVLLLNTCVCLPARLAPPGSLKWQYSPAITFSFLSLSLLYRSFHHRRLHPPGLASPRHLPFNFPATTKQEVRILKRFCILSPFTDSIESYRGFQYFSSMIPAIV